MFLTCCHNDEVTLSDYFETTISRYSGTDCRLQISSKFIVNMHITALCTALTLVRYDIYVQKSSKYLWSILRSEYRISAYVLHREKNEFCSIDVKSDCLTRPFPLLP